MIIYPIHSIQTHQTIPRSQALEIAKIIQQLNLQPIIIPFIKFIGQLLQTYQTIMNSRLMHCDNLYAFSLVRYEPNDILLLDKRSRQPYAFHQLGLQAVTLPQFSHPHLLRPILYKNGVLYPKGVETLGSLLEQRRRDYTVVKYSQQQIFNTFSPVLECIDQLHQKDIIHGSISLDSIVFFENGQILLKDWLYCSPANPFYPQGLPSKSSDLKAIGKIIAFAACLFPIEHFDTKSIEQLVSQMLEDKYSESFCYAVCSLMKGLERNSSNILSLLNGSDKNLPDLELQRILESAKLLKQRKEEDQQKRKKIQIKKQKKVKEAIVQKPKIEQIKKESSVMESKINTTQQPSIQGSPTKKFNITAPNKKLMRLEDSENKKHFNEEVKKRQIEKITKIIQRSNAFVNELMARRNNDKKAPGNKMNASLYEAQENSAKKAFLKESPKVGSPSKRLRSISKKK